MKSTFHRLSLLFACYCMLMPHGSVAAEPIWQQGEGNVFRLAPEASTSYEVFIPQPGKDKVVTLSWRARIDADRQRGGREFLRITVNGESVAALRDRLSSRILNKPAVYVDQRGRRQRWYVHGAQGWLVPFADDFSPPNPTSRFSKAGTEAYEFSVDVTDLVRLNSENTVSVHNLMKKRYFHKYKRRYFQRTQGDLVVEGLRFGWGSRSVDQSMPRAPQASSVAWRVKAVDDRIVLQRGPLDVEFASRFADGNGGWVSLPGPDAKMQPSASDAGGQRMVVETPNYRVERTLRLEEGRIRIEDRLMGTRREAAPIVIAPRYRLLVPGAVFGTAWIGGDSDPMLNDQLCPFNPTLFVPMAGSGIGVAVEDDVMRLQGRYSYDARKGSAEIRSDEMVLSAETSYEYTVRLTLYPTSHDDYWQFINTLRTDRNGAREMPGAIWFTVPRNILLSNPESIRSYIEENRVAYVIFWESPDPNDYGLSAPYIIKGAAQLGHRAEKYRGRFESDEKEAAARLHRLSPQVKVLFYVHSHVCTAVDAGEMAAFQDAWVTDKSGKPVRRHADDPRYFPFYFICPTLENSYGEAFARLVDHLLSLGADGIYWDEMPAGLREARCTYSQFDGHSADIDLETQRVRRQKGLVGLLSSPYKAAQVRKLAAMDKVVHANGAPETLLLQKLPMTVMVETKTSAALTRRLHLTTPYAYTWGPFSVGQCRERLAAGGLCFRPGRNTEFVARSFPITPTQLGPGHIAGPERVITAVDGMFGWKGDWQADLTVFDASGRVIEEERLNGKGLRNVSVPTDSLVIMERRD